MAYQVLYRRFRPQRFEDILGQDHIIPILKREIETGNISHAYLFSGPRGTGKTTAAKVFARAVNCENPKNGEACMKCPACLSESSGTIPNIIEIDAASNRGIDEIRQLRENISFLPSNAKYRVYIIDEVHMLTTEAFNALLKTLEEPPEHIIFIFATTEVHKILPTILSRCQRFDFKRIHNSIIKQNLEKIFGEIGISCEPQALDIIADSADGGMRDALSIADKVLAASSGREIRSETVQKVLGLMGQDDVFKIAEAISDADAAAAFKALTEAISAGSDVENITDGLTEYFRNLMIFISVSDYKTILYKGEKYFDSLKRSSINVNNELLVAFIRELTRIKADGRYITNTRFLLETTILKLCDKSSITEYLSLTSRVDKLEAKLESLLKNGLPYVSAPPAQKNAEPQQDNAQHQEVPDAEITENPPVKNVSELPPTDKNILADMQQQIAFASKYIFNSKRDIMLSNIFNDLKVASFNGSDLYIYPSGTSVHMMKFFEEKNGVEELRQILEAKLNKHINVILTPPSKSQSKSKSLIDTAKEIMGDMQEITDLKEI